MTPDGLQEGLSRLAELLRLLLEMLSLAAVLVGLALTLLRGLASTRRSRPRSLSAVRVGFGSWLSLALEFQLGADIVATTTSPGRDHLIQLAVVAVIRTLLNVFLARELEAERRLGSDVAPREVSHEPG